MADTTDERSHETHDYPYVIRAAGPVAMRLFDQAEEGLIEDGYTQDEADMLLSINVDQILEAAKTTAAQEAAADKRRAANEKQQRQDQQGRQGRHGNSHRSHNPGHH